MTEREKEIAGEQEKAERFDIARLASFSDGVFAVAITLLVLSFAVPQLPKGKADELLGQELMNLAPIYWAYLVSFFVIGLFWFGHHRLFIRVPQHDVGLFWLNLLLLMLIVFIPFPTHVMAQYPDSEVSTIFYACSIAVAGIVICAVLTYVRWKKLGELEPAFYLPFYSGYLMMSAVFLLSIPIAFTSVSIAKYFWLILIPANTFFDRFLVKKLLKRKSGKPGSSGVDGEPGKAHGEPDGVD